MLLKPPGSGPGAGRRGSPLGCFADRTVSCCSIDRQLLFRGWVQSIEDDDGPLISYFRCASHPDAPSYHFWNQPGVGTTRFVTQLSCRPAKHQPCRIHALRFLLPGISTQGLQVKNLLSYSKSYVQFKESSGGGPCISCSGSTKRAVSFALGAPPGFGATSVSTFHTRTAHALSAHHV